jgi:hypothetical protein
MMEFFAEWNEIVEGGIIELVNAEEITIRVSTFMLN